MSLFQQFVKQARAAQRRAYDQRVNDARTAWRQKYTSGPEGIFSSDLDEALGAKRNNYGVGDYEFDKSAGADMIKQLMNTHFDQARVNLDAHKKNQATDVENRRKAALDEMTRRNNQLRKQADTTLKSPVKAPNVVPGFNPLDPTSTVDTDTALAGGNAATQQFYVAPDSAQSQFNVTTPVGGGITGRNKGSTERLTSETDTLGSKRKEEF